MIEINKWYIIIAAAAFIAAIIFINQDFIFQPGAYNTGCCTWEGNKTCGFDCPPWNGICTEEIKDQCCEPVRVCSGQVVDDPWECYIKYCWDEKMCLPEYDVATAKYKCVCTTEEQL